MPVETIPNGSSWFLGGNTTQVEQPTQEPVLPTNVEQNVPPTTPQEPVVQEGSSEQVVVPEVPTLPSTITEVFDTLLNNKDGNYGFYEGKRIETLEDVADFVEINTNHRLEQTLQNQEMLWLQRKPPVYQQFAEMANYAGDDYTKFYDFLQTQQQIDDYNVLDATNPSHAELIVENYMRSKGEPEDLIRSEVTDLKERNKLTERAEKYKPVMVKTLETQKQQALQQERQAETEYYNAINTNQKDVEAFLQPDSIAGIRVKNEDKDTIYEDLVFDPGIKGFRIYQKIEEKQKAKDFETLSLISLILNNKDRFNELYGSNIKASVAKELRGKIVFGQNTVEGGKDTDPKALPRSEPTKAKEPDPNLPWHLRQ